MSEKQTINAARFGLNQAEAALYIGVAPNSFNTMIEEGIMPAPRSWHNRLFWLRDELETSLRNFPMAKEQTPDRWRATG